MKASSAETKFAFFSLQLSSAPAGTGNLDVGKRRSIVMRTTQRYTSQQEKRLGDHPPRVPRCTARRSRGASKSAVVDSLVSQHRLEIARLLALNSSPSAHAVRKERS